MRRSVLTCPRVDQRVRHLRRFKTRPPEGGPTVENRPRLRGWRPVRLPCIARWLSEPRRSDPVAPVSESCTRLASAPVLAAGTDQQAYAGQTDSDCGPEIRAALEHRQACTPAAAGSCFARTTRISSPPASPPKRGHGACHSRPRAPDGPATQRLRGARSAWSADRSAPPRWPACYAIVTLAFGRPIEAAGTTVDLPEVKRVPVLDDAQKPMLFHA